MPKNTFTNLPEAKRRQFIETSLAYFSKYHFKEASISEIVRDLGIAKGSVYQYFESKEELYQYLLNQALKKRIDVLQIIVNRSFETVRSLLYTFSLVSIKFEQSMPNWSKLHLMALHEQHVFNGRPGKVNYLDQLLKQYRIIIERINVEEMDSDIEDDLLTYYCHMFSHTFSEYIMIKKGFRLDFASGSMEDAEIIMHLDRFFTINVTS